MTDADGDGLSIERRAFRLPLLGPLRTGVGTITERRGWILRVEDGAGHVGWGEAAPLPGMPGGSAESVDAALSAWIADPGGALPPVPVAQGAVDTALATLEAARSGHALSTLLSADAATAVEVNGLLGGGEPARAATGLVEVGHRTVKIKLGAVHRDPAAAAAHVRDVRDGVGPSVALRVDANRSWTVDGAAAALEAMADLDIEYVEEPTADPDAWAGLAGLGVPLAQDESFDGVAALVERIEAGVVTVAVLKIPILGGVRPLVSAAEQVRAAGGRVVVTSFIDTGVGLTAAVHAAAAVATPGGPAAGVGTGRLLGDDVAAAPPVVGGRVAVPNGPGLGVDVVW